MKLTRRGRIARDTAVCFLILAIYAVAIFADGLVERVMG